MNKSIKPKKIITPIRGTTKLSETTKSKIELQNEMALKVIRAIKGGFG